jgi:hypothetical protein
MYGMWHIITFIILVKTWTAVTSHRNKENIKMFLEKEELGWTQLIYDKVQLQGLVNVTTQ